MDQENIRYFNLCKIAEASKVELPSLYMTGKAELWVAGYLSNRKNVDWEDFKFYVVARFQDNSCNNVVENYNKLVQVGSLEDYIDSFEHANSDLSRYGYALCDEYMLDSFIGGLKSEIRPFVKAFNPRSISEATKLTRLREKQLAACSHQTVAKPSPYRPLFPHNTDTSQARSLANHPNASKPPLIPTPSPNLQNNLRPLKHIPADVKEAKIAKGLYYYCDKKI